MNDMKMFDSYRKDYTRNTSGKAYCSVEHLLRFWNANKGEYLKSMFGDQLILERDIVYDKPHDAIQSDMYNMIDNYDNFLRRLTNGLADVMGVNYDRWNSHDSVKDLVWHALRHCICNAGALVDNQLDLGHDGWTDEGPKYIKQYTIEFQNGKKVVLQRGMKTTRAFNQIAKNLDMEAEWEDFRIHHSQVLNTKRMTGTLCLSIHPLDYATASDNDNGWSSCMSWNDYGCYRMGTVEMMNSPMVICAYLKSKKQHMEIAGEEWNSKKWRAWVIVTKDVILVNRHYPYHMEELAIQCINWVRELAEKAQGWTYEDPHTDFYQWMRDVDYEMEFHTNYMYNDLGGEDVIGCFKSGWNRRNMPGIVNFSGPAECMICGEEIYPDSQEPGQLECDDCWSEYRCDECGDSLCEDDVYHDPDGNVLCYACYDRICTTCSCCEETIYRDDATQVSFPVRWDRVTDEQKALLNRHYTTHNTYNSDFSWMFERKPDCVGEVTVCDDCARKYGVQTVEYSGEDDTGVAEGEYIVMNPNRVDMHSALSMINAPGYEYATYVINRMNRGMWRCDDPEDDHAYYQGIVDFWTEQWTRFQKEFETHKNL